MNLFSLLSQTRDISFAKDISKTKVGLTVLFLILGLNFHGFSSEVSHKWLESHRGYSLEQIPGTGIAGVPLEYVAAGTAYPNGINGKAAWHFMRIDANGNILASRMSFAQSGDEYSFRVVDIATESSTKFWITIQARNQAPGNEIDFIYIAGVDQNGNDLPLNPAIAISSSTAATSNKNFYPTHSLYLGSALYICGYSSDGTEYPNNPDSRLSPKLGWFLKCDVNSTPVTTTFDFWNTPGNAPFTHDYDMPLRLSPSLGSGGTATFPILLTGAANFGDDLISGILAMKYNSNATNAGANTYVPVAYLQSYEIPRVTGVYGVDMRGQLYAGDIEENEGGYAILVNFFDDIISNNKTWGILRVKSDLTVYNSSTNFSYVYLGDYKSWATQFLELSYADKGSSNNVTVLGQQFDLYGNSSCYGTLPAPSKAPSTLNVNPFLANFLLNGSSVWNTANGFSPTYNVAGFIPNKVYLSSKGTKSNTMDYLAGSLGVNAALEDVSRLYTFGAINQHYIHYPYPLPATPPAMVVPVAERYMHPSTLGDSVLHTKFIQTDASYNETSCYKHIQDCPPLFTSPTNQYSEFTSNIIPDDVSNAYLYFTLINTNFSPGNIDCSTGYYKSTGVASAANIETIKIYPNPASDELTIDLNGSLHATDLFSFSMTDMTGKVVYCTETVPARNTKAKIHLPELTSGVYMGTINLNGKKRVEKIVIQ